MRPKDFNFHFKAMRAGACVFYALLFLALTLALEISHAKDAAETPPGKGPAAGHKDSASAQEDPQAQLALAMAYYTGEGIPKDVERSIHWFTKSAEGGSSEAQFNLGVLYSTGQGVAENSLKAAEWFTKAAALGNTRAWYNLGVLYAKGAEGVRRDVRRALGFFEKSAFSGDPKGQAGLAWFYGDGIGVEPDQVKAYAWACLAAERDEQGRAMKPLLEKKLSTRELAAAAELTRSLKSQLEQAAQSDGGVPEVGSPANKKTRGAR